MDLCNSIKSSFRIIWNALIIFFLFILTMAKAGQLSHNVELFIGIVNSSEDITFTLTAESAIWGANTWYDDLLLTDSYNTSQYTADKDLEDEDSWEGWNFVTSIVSNYHPAFGWGLYKLCRNDTNDYFYLDFRDDRYGNYSAFGDPLGHAIDLWIKYDNFLSEFYYSTDGYVPWIRINNGTTLSIWEIKQMGNPTRARFQPTNPTGLTVTKVNNHPKLTWTPSSAPASGPKYHVYRAADLTFHCIASYLDTNTYTDDDVTFNKFGDTYHYKVRAVSGDSAILSPGYSNVVSFLGDGPIEKKIVPKPVNEQPDIISVKVFPNPFNSTM